MAAQRITVTCPAGHEIRTRSRSRGVQCSECGKTVYVRADGTTRRDRPEPGRTGAAVADSSRRGDGGGRSEPPRAGTRTDSRRRGGRVALGGHPYEDVTGPR